MLLLLLVLALFSLIILLVILLPNHMEHEKLNHPPGPKGLPLIGNLHQLDPSDLHFCLSKLADTYGPMLSLKFGFRRVVVIQSVDLAKVILKTQDHNFCMRPSLTGLQKLSYNGLGMSFGAYGEYLREIRKICVVHLFSSKKVQASSHVRREEISRMIQNIDSLSSSSQVVRLSELVTTLTSSIICRIAFGKRYNEGVEKSRFDYVVNEAEEMFTAFFLSDYFPYVGGWLDKLMGLSSRLERVFKDLDELYEEIINDHLNPSKLKSDKEDIVDVLLQLKKERCFSFDLTLGHIKAIIMDILLAGTDTSAAMVVWAMTELIKHPKIMRKAQDELRTMIQDKSFIDEDDLSKLNYFKAIVKETFRLHPALPLLLPREAIQKCTIQGYDILPKTLIYVNIWTITRDPSIWKDPEKFIPERFLESKIDFRRQDFELIPFGTGRRICPGIFHGIANFEVGLANLLYTFDWQLPIGLKEDDIDTEVNFGIVMRKKSPLCLVAKKFSSK